MKNDQGEFHSKDPVKKLVKLCKLRFGFLFYHFVFCFFFFLLLIFILDFTSFFFLCVCERSSKDRE